MKKIITFIFLCTITHTAQKLSHHEKDPFSTRMLFLFFDLSEKIDFTQSTNKLPVTNDVITALSEQLPFIATPNLLHNAFTYLHIFQDAQMLSLQDFKKKHSEAPQTLHRELKNVKLVIDQIQQELIPFASSFTYKKHKKNEAISLDPLWNSSHFRMFLQNNGITTTTLTYYWNLYLYSTIDYKPEEWVIKKLNETLYLFIPKKTYPQILNSYKPLPRQPDNYTTIELQFGLALDHIPHITQHTFHNVPSTINEITFTPEQLFIPLSAYKNSTITPQSWSFYISAHGSSPEQITPHLKESETNIRTIWKHITTFEDPFQAFTFPPKEAVLHSNNIIENIAHNNYRALSQNIQQLRAILPQLTLKKSFKDKLILTCDNYLQMQASTAQRGNPHALISTLYQDLQKLNNDILNITNNSSYITKYLTDAQKFKKLSEQGVTTFNYIGTLDTFALHSLFTFFNNELDTRCVLINACYSGSETFITLQKNLETFSDYNFILIVQGITDTITFSSFIPFIPPDIPYMYVNNSAKLVFTSSQPYKELFVLLTQKTPWPSLQEIAQSISHDSASAHNIIQYKQPHLAWSTIALEPHTTVTLQKTLINNHSGPLNISTFFGKQTYNSSTKTIKKQKAYPKNIIISAPEIPFPLLFERTGKQAFPTIIAEKPSNTMHYITEINAPQYTIKEILQGFFTLGQTIASEKVWYIENIKAQDAHLSRVRIILHAELPNTPEPINAVLHQDQKTQAIMRELWYARNPFPHTLTFNRTTEQDYQILDKHIQDKGYFITRIHANNHQPVVENILQKKLSHKVLESRIRQELYTLPEDLAYITLILTAT